MYYEINVSKKDGRIYRHLFATAKRSCSSNREAAKVLHELLEKFPDPLYKVSMIKWEEEGFAIDPTKFMLEHWDDRIDG